MMELCYSLFLASSITVLVQLGYGFRISQDSADCGSFSQAVVDYLDFAMLHTEGFPKVQQNVLAMTGIDLADHNQVRKVACQIARTKNLQDVAKTLDLPYDVVRMMYGQLVASQAGNDITSMLNMNQFLLAIKHIAIQSGLADEVTPVSFDIIPYIKDYFSRDRLKVVLTELVVAFGSGFPGYLTMSPDADITLPNIDTVVNALMDCSDTSDFAAGVGASLPEVTQLQMGLVSAILLPPVTLEGQIVYLKLIHEMDKLGLTNLN